MGDEVRSYRIRPERWTNENAKLACDRGGQVRPYACTASCPTPCNATMPTCLAWLPRPPV